MNWRIFVSTFLGIMLSANVLRAADSFISFTTTLNRSVCLSPSADTIVCDPSDWEGVKMAVANLRNDFKAVTGSSNAPIVVATVGKSAIAKRYSNESKQLKGKWEQYLIFVDNGKLVILGSDKRGTIYGIYELSRQIGVSPWYWWADIPIAHHDSIFAENGVFTDGEPKVKYRGIFINDENPCLQGWARKKFGGMNSQMYSHVYELLLRMKANLLWPGMWGTFKEYRPLESILYNENGEYEGNCFNWDDPNNPRLADAMGVVIGTSHHEPMQRSQQEWVRTKQNYGNGEWNYMTNEEGLKQFFREGIESTKLYESMITMGLRGEEDRPMADAGGREANMRLLKKIVSDQRQIIEQVTKKPASKTPQVWTLYSEMLDYYEEGLQVPEDVTIMLCDDNWGDVRKIPTPETRNRKGGFGMYYHFGYYGAPRAMKWLQQMQIQHIWQQMNLAYQGGIDRIWITNVGDIKPAEFVTQFFMDMAWNPDRFNASNLVDYAEDFCRWFAGDNAKEAAHILSAYNKYAARVTAEMLDQNTYSLERGEWTMVRNEFLALEAEALRLKEKIGEGSQASYNQIILYPVQALANLHDMYYSVAKNHYLYSIGDIEANRWADHAEDCFKRDSLLTYHYNKVMSGGKWDNIMTEVHIGYNTWHAPQFNKMPEVKRLDEVMRKTDGFVYKADRGRVVMDASHYFRAETDEGMSWTVIPDLGRTASALALMPSNVIPQKASLTYRMQMTECPDSLNIHLVFSTVMPFVPGGHNVSVAFEGCKGMTINLNKDMNWAHCYDLMYPAGAARVIEKDVRLSCKQVAKNMLQLNISTNSPGIVLQRIIVDTNEYKASFLNEDTSIICK